MTKRLPQIDHLRISHDLCVSIAQRHRTLFFLEQSDLGTFERFNRKCEEQWGITYEYVKEEEWEKLVAGGYKRALVPPVVYHHELQENIYGLLDHPTSALNGNDSLIIAGNDNTDDKYLVSKMQR